MHLARLTLALVLLAGSVRAQEPSPADELWKKLQTLERSGPQKKFTTLAERQTVLTEFLGEIDKLCEQFITEFPDDKRVWEARLDRLHVVNERAALGVGTVDLAIFEERVAEIVTASAASKPVKSQASFLRLQARGRHLSANPQPDQLESFDKLLEEYRATYPNDPATRQLPMLRLQVYEAVSPVKTAELLKEMANDKNPALAMEAKRRLKAQELKGKPLDLKFTTVDGKEFDLAKLRGKVVLVDFWATWCGPCRVEMPNVIKTYEKYRDKGFEIVGISLDANKEKLLAYTTEQKMPWPQYFDGKAWENEISTNYGITSIPTMWLVDKKGYVRNTEAREGLDEHIAKLLAE
jgi:thiol-disulfide isomerase/thioredoxin